MYLFAIFLLFLPLYLYSECPYLAAKKNIQNPPRSQGSSRLFGDFPEAQNNAAKLMDTLLQNHNTSIVEIDIPCSKILNRYFAILSPTIAQQILLDTSDAFSKGSIEQHTEKNIFPPEGLIWMPANERWELLNNALFNGPFNPQCFPNCYTDIFHKAFIWFIERLEKTQQPFDLYQQCTYYSMRTMAHAFFNYILEDKELIAITDALKFMFTFMHQRETTLCNIPLLAPLPQHRLFYHHRKTFNTILKKIIKNAPYTVTHNGITYPTIMGILITHRDPITNKALTDDEIISHVATLFFAGHDTTANFITMLIYHLSITPTWYDLIQNELATKFNNRSLEWLPLNTLPEYTCFKNEILRLFPSVPLVSIDTTKNIILDEYKIPKKSTLFIALHTIQKNPTFFKNPETFNPHRFNHDDQDYTPSTKSSMMPFNFGRRRCLGQWFAQAEAQHLITHIISKNIHFTVEPLKKPLGLTVELSGMPNQKIFANIHVPEDYIQKKCHQNTRKKTTISATTQDLPMRIISIRYENEEKTIKTYRLGPLHRQTLPFAYNPGDHLELIAKNNNGQTVIRHYSISSSPTDSDEWLEITIKKEEYSTKTVSHFMHDELTEHDILFIRAPMDDGVRVCHNDAPTRPLILISGGIGITPMMSILRYCAAHEWPGEIYLIHTCKTIQECAFYEELIAFNEHHKNIHIAITFTQQDSPQKKNHFSGRINQTMLDTMAIKDIEKAKCYICGKETMCTELSELLHTRYTIPKSAIHHLSFGTFDTKKALQNTYTLEEIASHNTRTDAWMVIDNIVYDVTDYLSEHPGLDIILDYIGKDATNAFNQTAHSASAKKLLNQSSNIKIMGHI